MENIPEKSSISIPHSELLNAGCTNCVWKLHGQCPYGLQEDDIYPDNIRDISKISTGTTISAKGICPEMINFLISLAGNTPSIPAIWERYHIYKAQLQEGEDYKDFVQLNQEIKKLEKELKEFSANNGPRNADQKSPNEIQELLEKLRSDRFAAKVWWQKLNAHVVQSLGKVRDREVKAEGSQTRVAGINAKTINFINNNEVVDNGGSRITGQPPKVVKKLEDKK